MHNKPTLLWVGRDDPPDNVRQAAGEQWRIDCWRPGEDLSAKLERSVVAVVDVPALGDGPDGAKEVLSGLAACPTVGVLLIPRDATGPWGDPSRIQGPFISLPADADAARLAGALEAGRSLSGEFGRMASEVKVARQQSDGADKRLEVLGEEMRLAARLQRDFLPKTLPEVDPLRFGVLYRPASWVSGDIYDITRLDENTLGFYVVDAVGHGMPAALLTMFIKKALQTKRIVEQSYEIISPEVSMAELNIDICEQNLSSCQFCTAVYAIVDARTLELTYARAGHPEPLLIHPDGEIESLDAEGSLLGVFEDAKFEVACKQLVPGDRLVLYSDGAEEALRGAMGSEDSEFIDAIRFIAGMQREEALLRLTAAIETQAEKLTEPDDVTILVADVLADNA